MVEQYPHSVKIEWNSAALTNNDGNAVKGAANVFFSKCRAEANGSGRAIPSVNGALVTYSYSVYMPKINGERIPFGAKATLTIEGVDSTITVKGAKTGFYNSVLWL